MKITNTICMFFVVFTSLCAQSTFETKAKEIAERIEQVTNEEKLKLKDKIAMINDRLDAKEINKEEAEELSIAAAQETADHITQKVTIMQEELTQLIQEKVNEEIDETTVEQIETGPSPWDDSEEWGYKKEENTYDGDWNFDFHFPRFRNESRHTSQFVFAIGVNSFVRNRDFGTLGENPLSTFSSNNYEYGFTGKYRMFKSSNFVHFKYGLSLLYSHLTPKGNNYFAVDGIKTEIKNFDGSLDEVDLRNVYFTVPVHFEFDFTKGRRDKENHLHFRTQRAIRMGLGGFVGVKTGSRQKMEYRQNGNKINFKEKGDFNVNQYTYGLSAYLGYRSWSVYGNYHLNNIFENNDIGQNIVSVGLRFDWN